MANPPRVGAAISGNREQSYYYMNFGIYICIWISLLYAFWISLFSHQFTSYVHILYFLLVFFCVCILFHSCCPHVQVLETTFVYEFHISYCRTECYLFFLLGKIVLTYEKDKLWKKTIIIILSLPPYLVALFSHSCCFHAQVLCTTLVHEFLTFSIGILNKTWKWSCIELTSNKYIIARYVMCKALSIPITLEPTFILVWILCK